MSAASPTVDEVHLRRLLDLRAARTADIYHRRFPSLSEMSDSPSVYSHAQFSPQTIDRAELRANTESFHFAIPSQYHTTDYHEPRTPRFDRDRLNDPSASTLVLDDSSVSSRTNSEIYDDADYAEQDPDPEDEDDDPVRMSMLGPRMRFHSPAPWETGEDTLEEQDEPEDDVRSFVSSKRGRNWTKGFGIGSSKSRPSGESTRSSGKEKKSSETSSSGQLSAFGALQALAQSSTNSVGLVPQNAINPQTPSRSQTPSSSHTRNRTVSNAKSPSHPLQPLRQPNLRSHTYDAPAPSALDVARPSSPASFIPRPDTRSTYRSDSPEHFPTQSDYASLYSHPYANPDPSAYKRDSIHPNLDMFRAGELRGLPPTESNTTLQDSTMSPSSSRRGSVATVAVTPDTSPSSIGNSNADAASIRRSAGTVHGKIISGPIAVEGGHGLRSATSVTSIGSRYGDLQVPSSGLSRWTDLPASPTFNLISLEQAQAQVKSRSATANSTFPSSTFLDSEPPSRHPSKSSGFTARTRARSTSTGSKAKGAFENFTAVSGPVTPSAELEQVQDAGVSSRPPLKHKKSGFMRLFNGKEKEKEKSSNPPSPPPPIPSFYDGSPAVPAPLKPQKLPIPRVPVPTITPPPQEVGYAYSTEDELPTARVGGSLRPSSRGRRPIPPLTILPPSDSPGRVYSQSPNSADLSKANDRSRSTLHPDSTLSRGGMVPLSAPPGTSEFPSLSLRPVSTVFSAHFADHLVDNDLGSEPDTSTATTFSPLSPGFSLRSPIGKAGQEPMIAGEDSAAIIQALREHIATSRKTWQTQIWELEGQVRDLRAEVEELRARERDSGGEHCAVCGHGGLFTSGSPVDEPGSSGSGSERPSVVNRPRARTGVGGRFVARS